MMKCGWCGAHNIFGEKSRSQQILLHTISKRARVADSREQITSHKVTWIWYIFVAGSFNVL